MVVFTKDSAHVDICGASGKGKTYLAKKIINNHPHIDDIFVFSRNKQDWAEPKDSLADIENTWNLYTRINEHQLVRECIVVFDDFNNEAGINMWTNKIVKQMFTEGRKYGVYCILIHHSSKDTGNIARDNCYYKVLFPRGDAQELHAFSNLSFSINPDEVKQKYLQSLQIDKSYLLLKGAIDLQVINPTGPLLQNDAFKKTEPVGISSNVQNNGHIINSNINMHSHTINNLMQTNQINQNIEIQNIYHANEMIKLNKGLEIKELVKKHFITSDERDILISNLNQYTKNIRVSYENYKLVSVKFCKKFWPDETFLPPDARSRDTLNIGRNLLNGDMSSASNVMFSTLQPFIKNSFEDVLSSWFG